MAKVIKGTTAILLYSLFLVVGNSLANKIFPSDGLLLGQGFLFYLPFPALNLHYNETQPLYLGIFMSLAELFLFAFLWFKSKTRPLKILTIFLVVNLVTILVFRFLEVGEIIHSSYFSMERLFR
ncbi:MAG TPA: hypothetical protein VMW04_02500 [Patescibacteria group bacterium]|nr:hypothetical protein [Patescibacteria group bacterium]